MANSLGADQKSRSAESDLGLHCLLKLVGHKWYNNSVEKYKSNFM